MVTTRTLVGLLSGCSRLGLDAGYVSLHRNIATCIGLLA